MKLSIITPYYNALEYIKELAKVLEPQLNNDVEWIIVDDGCNEYQLDKIKAKVIHLPINSGCAGIPRNFGLDIAIGDYITFIDSDDLVSSDFIQKIIDKINFKKFNYCLMSWEKIDNRLYVDVTNGRPDWNCSVWGIIYNKENIKNVRFNNKRIAEDYDFNAAALFGTEEKIIDVLYYYRSNENGITATREEQ